nr:hypothetical protein CFP56_00394 [Quercus suber]
MPSATNPPGLRETVRRYGTTVTKRTRAKRIILQTSWSRPTRLTTLQASQRRAKMVYRKNNHAWHRELMLIGELVMAKTGEQFLLSHPATPVSCRPARCPATRRPARPGPRLSTDGVAWHHSVSKKRKMGRRVHVSMPLFCTACAVYCSMGLMIRCQSSRGAVRFGSMTAVHIGFLRLAL